MIISAKIIALSEAQNHRCAYCGTAMRLDDPLHFDSVSTDHVIPRSDGGQKGFDNEVAACRFCNGNRSSITAEVYFYMVQQLGRRGAAEKARPLNIAINRKREMAGGSRRSVRPVQKLAETALERARRSDEYLAKAGAIALSRPQKRAQMSLVGHDLPVGHANIGREPTPVKRPNGKAKDCNFDPAWLKVVLLRPIPKRLEPPPLSAMSKAHRRRVKMAAQAIAPMMTA